MIFWILSSLMVAIGTAVGLIYLLDFLALVTEDAIFRAPNYERDQEEYRQCLKAREDEKG